MLLGIGITRGARKRRSKMLRHGNAPEIIDNHSPEPRLPAKKRPCTVAVRAASVST